MSTTSSEEEVIPIVEETKVENIKEIEDDTSTTKEEKSINKSTKQNKTSSNLTEHKNETTKTMDKQKVSFGSNEWSVVIADGKSRLQFLLSKFTSAEKIKQAQTNLLLLAIKQVFHEYNLTKYVLLDY